MQIMGTYVVCLSSRHLNTANPCHIETRFVSFMNYTIKISQNGPSFRDAKLPARSIFEFEHPLLARCVHGIWGIDGQSTAFFGLLLDAKECELE